MEAQMKLRLLFCLVLLTAISSCAGVPVDDPVTDQPHFGLWTLCTSDEVIAMVDSVEMRWEDTAAPDSGAATTSGSRP